MYSNYKLSVLRRPDSDRVATVCIYTDNTLNTAIQVTTNKCTIKSLQPYTYLTPVKEVTMLQMVGVSALD